MTRVRSRIRRKGTNTSPEGYKLLFEKLSRRWGLIVVDDQLAILHTLGRLLLNILHFGHSGVTKMTAEAKIFWCPQERKSTDHEVRNFTASIAIGKSPVYPIPKHIYGDVRAANGEISKHMITARTNSDEKQLASDLNFPKMIVPVRYPFHFNEKYHDRNSLESWLHAEIQTAFSSFQVHYFRPRGRFGKQQDQQSQEKPHRKTVTASVSSLKWMVSYGTF